MYPLLCHTGHNSSNYCDRRISTFFNQETLINNFKFDQQNNSHSVQKQRATVKCIWFEEEYISLLFKTFLTRSKSVYSSIISKPISCCTTLYETIDGNIERMNYTLITKYQYISELK